MGKAEALIRDLGDTLDESIGVRDDATDTADAQQSEPQPVGPQDGFTRYPGFGMMELANIIPDENQIRQDLGDAESLNCLTASIAQKGLLQPIRVRWDEAIGKHVVVVGGRRLKAAQLAGLDKVPVICVSDRISQIEIVEEMIFENQHRLDLSDIEVANSYRRYLNLTGSKAKDLAALLHVAPSTISKALSLLNLDESVQEQVSTGAIPAKVGHEIAKLRDPDVQKRVASRAVAEDLPAPAVAKVVRQRQGPAAPKPKATPKDTVFHLRRGLRIIISSRTPISGEEVVAALEQALGMARADLEK